MQCDLDNYVSYCTVSWQFSAYRKWRQEKAALLEKMDNDEKDDIAEWREKARKELHDWYERRDEQLGKTQTSNR